MDIDSVPIFYARLLLFRFRRTRTFSSSNRAMGVLLRLRTPTRVSNELQELELHPARPLTRRSSWIWIKPMAVRRRKAKGSRGVPGR